ncbi:MAG: DUF3347 domain-containing protein [Chitinophagaceae bacterium]
MKKVVIVILILVAGFAIVKLFFANKGESGAGGPKQEALTVSKNSVAFNESVEKLLNSYFLLKDGLTEYDTSRVNNAAAALALAADSLATSELRGDTTGVIKQTAEDFAGSISGSSKVLTSEPDLIKKKRIFNLISDAVYNLVRTVKYDRQKLYHQHCPMAFNDEEEAFWISNSNKIVNPYLGTKHPKYKASMEACGDITDSLDFSK